MSDDATPELLRFIDNSSRVDIMSFKSQFTNFPGTVQPTFTLLIYESDSEDGPWMKSEFSNSDTAIFVVNSKQYIKIELNIFFESQEEIVNLGLLLFVDILIHDLNIPVLSNSARSILSSFPSWSAIYEDSIESENPRLATPKSVGGSFINSLVGEHLDNFNSNLDLNDLNSFIATASEEMVDWLYISYNISAAALSVLGDSVPLSRCGSMDDLYSSRKTDYIYYHNLADNQIITLREFETLQVDQFEYGQEPLLYFNSFDEFGTRVGLKRLYLENNENYKKRILDTYQNIPSVDLEGFKRTLRRELDIWRAYGATPDSNYLGATPEVLEISDIEDSALYSSPDGVPRQKLFDFVRSINELYPSSFGYIKWEEGIWDVAGIDQEGINTIPFTYDASRTEAEYFQPGVGDMDDFFVAIENDSFATVSFEGYFKADGLKVTSYKDVYAPIKIIYDYFGSYSITGIPNENADNPDSLDPTSNGGVNLVYELELKQHNQYATPSVFYKNFSYADRNDFIVKNFYSESSAASPEYNLIKVFNSDGLSDPVIDFYEKTYGYTYQNQLSTPTSSSIDIKNVERIIIKSQAKWNENSQQYENVTNAQYRIGFNEHSSGYQTNTIFGSEISISTPNINYINSNFKIGSTVYGTMNTFDFTDTNSNTVYINSDNDVASSNSSVIDLDDLKNSLVYPIGASVEDLFIINRKIYPEPIYGVDIYDASVKELEHGGYARDPYSNNDEYFVSSSPNIVFTTHLSSNGLGESITSDFFESATINYSSSINSIKISNSLSSTPNYPFKMPVFSAIGEEEYKSTPMIFGYLDSQGNAYRINQRIEDSGKSLDQKNKDNFVDEYKLTNKSLSISLEDLLKDQVIIFQINPVSLTEEVSLNSSKSFVKSGLFSPDTLIDIIDQNIDSIDGEPIMQYGAIPVDAKSTSFSNDLINILNVKQPSIKTGWLYLPENDYYAYAKPIIDVYNGQFFELNLSEYPMQGAPVIVESYNNSSTVNYQEVFFHDSSTPGQITFYNKELLSGSSDSSLYLSYNDISEISIEDLSSGKVLVNSPLNPEFYIWSTLDENGNYILDMEDSNQYYIATSGVIQSGQDYYFLNDNRFQVLNSVTQETEIIPGREYSITYKVNKSFYVERNNKKLYLSSTPSYYSNYKITYESSEYLSSVPSQLSINPIDNPLDEGYIYVSDEEYEFGYASVWISPQKIFKNQDDLIHVLIVSYDVNDNLKPNQTFRIYGNSLVPDIEYITTNENGFAKAIVRYSGSTDAVHSTLHIQGVSFQSEPTIAHPNSSSQSFYDEYDILLVENKVSNYTIKVASDKLKIRANGHDSIHIKGFLRDGNIPPISNAVVYWRKARTAYEALNNVPYAPDAATPGAFGVSGYVVADQYGNFTIGPFGAQERMDPGIWFVAVESEMSSTPSSNPITIYGDIAYWFENYDNIHYSNESLPLPRFYTAPPLTGDGIISKSRFQYNYHNSNESATPLDSSTPGLNWIPPKWFQISRYEQYQMGLLGSTPNVISTYEELYPDYEDN